MNGSPWEPPLGVAAVDRELEHKQAVKDKADQLINEVYPPGQPWQGLSPKHIEVVRQVLGKLLTITLPGDVEISVTAIVATSRGNRQAVDMMSTCASAEDALELLQDYLDHA